jgi:hypothetical protein
LVQNFKSQLTRTKPSPHLALRHFDEKESTQCWWFGPD